MHNIKRFLGKKVTVMLMTALLVSSTLVACSSSNKNTDPNPTATTSATDSAEVDYSNTPTGKELSVEFKTKDTNSNWKEESYETITLNGHSIQYDGKNATISNSTITITAGGVYHITGDLTDGQVIVNAAKTDFVWIVLDNASITNTKGAAIYAKQSDKVTVTLAENSKNTLTDGETYSYEGEEKAPTACLFSNDDLSINGSGQLTVTSNSADGISSKNDIKIVSGTITVNAKDDGIRGKDSVAIQNGTITITASGDVIKSTNTTEDENGYIYIENGTFHITAVNDGIQAEKSLCIKDGAFTITINGGSKNAVQKTENEFDRRGGFQQEATATATPEATTTESVSTSYKAVKAGNDIYITGGTFTIDSCDDAIHSNNTVNIDQGTFTITTGDDGMHADNALTINNGTIDVVSSYEGLEAAALTINDGTINITASDDGMNAAGGADSSQGNAPFGGDNFKEGTDYSITFNGGTITVNSEGDGLDANGSIYQNGGTIYVNGTTMGGNGSLDYDNSYIIKGGVLITTGSSEMAQAPSTDSTQNSIFIQYSNTMNAGSEIKLANSKGATVLSYTSTKNFTTIVLSSADIKQNETYTLYDGATKLCTITPTSSLTCVTDSGEQTTISENAQGGGRGNGMKGGQGQAAPNGEMPETPNGEIPEAPNGEMPKGSFQPDGSFQPAPTTSSSPTA